MATGNVDAKLLKQTKFPPEFNQKVDMTKVNLEVMKKCVRSASLGFLIANGCIITRWIAEKISDILGNEDDVVTELCFNLLEASRYVSPRASQYLSKNPSLTSLVDAA